MSVTAASSWAPNAANAGVGPVQFRSSTESNNGMSVRGRERAKQKGAVALREPSGGRPERPRTALFTSPRTPVRRNRFQMAVLGEDSRRGFCTPPASRDNRPPRHPPGQVIRHRCGGTPNLAITPPSSLMCGFGFICTTRCAAQHALCEILVGRADDYAVEPAVASGRAAADANASSARTQPSGQTATPIGRRGRLRATGTGREGQALDAVAGFVSRPEPVSNDLDDVVRGGLQCASQSC